LGARREGGTVKSKIEAREWIKAFRLRAAFVLEEIMEIDRLKV
jgi:hypothetical protein